MTVVVESFYLSNLLFEIIVSIVSFAIILLALFEYSGKHKKILFYLSASSLVIFIGSMFGLYTFLFNQESFAGYMTSSFLESVNAILLILILIEIRKKYERKEEALFFSLLLITFIFLGISLTAKSYEWITFTSFLLLFFMVFFYIAIFSLLNKICDKKIGLKNRRKNIKHMGKII